MKNGLQEIISSGRAPGILAGSPAVDPDSVMAKAPKALAQMERGERRSKRGISARDISRHFGMSVDFIKHTWSRPFKKKAVVNLIILALLWHSYPVQSADITPGTSFTDGQTVSAAQLALLASGTINTSFYTSKTIDPTPLSSDYLLVYSPTLLGFYKVTSGNLFANAFQQTAIAATPGTPGLLDIFPFYSAGNTNLEQTHFLQPDSADFDLSKHGILAVRAHQRQFEQHQRLCPEPVARCLRLGCARHQHARVVGVGH